MPTLREVQVQFARSLVSGDDRVIAQWIAGGGAVPVEDRIAIHRGNCAAALVHALRLTYPAIEALVGQAFFARAAAAFARSRPPSSPFLAGYGDGFGEVLSAFPETAAMPYLGEVARVEWAVAQAAASPPGWAGEGHVLGAFRIRMPRSLRLIGVRHSATAIWRAAIAGDEAALSRIAPDGAATTAAIWRAGAGADVAGLGPAAGAFVAALLAREDIGTALARAAALTADPITVVADEVLRAGFIHMAPVVPLSDGGLQ